ncbi:Transcriptional repressor arc (modular protein) [uncultured Alphaproteobacteria bacterium]|uniref:Transcriptional repressor arc (Modular protein) n=1 Tax=uncultured Alphaproteobacteria bacterium TaxID=91750 RepID=A0A212KM10_9PROT|nr:Transcriptional repressor arc (modular protein) [uncultured Alphaproteobacteria bacterium]
MSDAPTRDQNKFIVRMPDGMRDRIREAAEANNRSMNAEIVARLEESFSGETKLSLEAVRELIPILAKLVKADENAHRRPHAPTILGGDLPAPPDEKE